MIEEIGDWYLACPECGERNSPLEGHVNTDAVMVLRYVCDACEQKYEREEQLNQVKVTPLMNFRRPKLKWGV